MYLARELTQISLPKIGREFGGTDHTTVMHAYDKIEQGIRSNAQLKQQVSDLKTMLEHAAH